MTGTVIQYFLFTYVSFWVMFVTVLYGNQESWAKFSKSTYCYVGSPGLMPGCSAFLGGRVDQCVYRAHCDPEQLWSSSLIPVTLRTGYHPHLQPLFCFPYN